MLLCAGGLLLLAILTFSLIDVVEASWFAQLSGRIPGLEYLNVLTGFIFCYAVTLVLIFVVGLIFYFVPNAEVRFRDVWLGAVITGLCGEGRSRAFRGTSAIRRGSACMARLALS